MAAQQQRVVAIVNPSAGGGSAARRWAKAVLVLRAGLAQAGWSLEEVFTDGPGSATALAAQAAAAAADVVLAVGGDGTIHEVAAGLVQRDHASQQASSQRHTALAVLPLGTGSDYARSFAWTANAAGDACDRILGGRRQLVDVSRIELQPAAAAGGGSSGAPSSSVFMNVASCGVGAEAARRVGRFKQLGGGLSYSLAAVQALLGYRPATIKVTLDGGESRVLESVTALVCGHGRYWGGGLQVLPDADPGDGAMDVVVMQQLGLLDFITKGHLLRSGKHQGVKGVAVLPRCRRLRVEVVHGGRGIAWEGDGEPLGALAAADISVLPGALPLLV